MHEIRTKVDQAKFFFTLLLIRPQGDQGSIDPRETIELEFVCLKV